MRLGLRLRKRRCICLPRFDELFESPVKIPDPIRKDVFSHLDLEHAEIEAVVFLPSYLPTIEIKFSMIPLQEGPFQLQSNICLPFPFF